MKIFVAAVAALALGAIAAPARAQIAGALGKPLTSADLPNGTVSVRVIAGDPSQPVIGTDVTLTVGGAVRTARTDTQGRAVFPNVPGATTVVASVRGDEGEISSERFPSPVTGGVRLLLSTKPLAPSGDSGGPAAPGGAPGGMPEPRNMSGQPRVEPKDPPGQITVRLSYNDFAAPAPDKHPVHLVAYSADGSISLKTAPTDASGRALFEQLDRTGGISYFAMTLLPRGGAVDRLVSSPITLDGNGGVRLILSADKRDSTQPAIDDLKNFGEQSPLPPGRVQVSLDFLPEANQPVRLIDVATGKAVGEVAPRPPTPEPGTVTAALDTLVEDTAAPAGRLTLAVVRSTERGGSPATDGVVVVRPVGAPTGIEVPITSGSNGQVTLDGLAVATPLEVVFRVGDEASKPVPLTLTKAARSTLTASWKARGVLEARFDGVAPEGVYYAETRARGDAYRSYPFQTVAARGTVSSIAVFTRLVLKFSLASSVEDTFLGVQGRYEVQNWSWAPYRHSPDGLLINLPKGNTGAVVFDAKEAVSADPSGAFRILRPLPPGGMRFHAGFSLKVTDGVVTWDMEFPFGTFGSGLQVREVKGMKVDLPTGATGRTMRDDDGTPYFVVSNLTARAGERLVMTFRGLPQPAAWSTWGPRIVGLVVLSMLAIGLAVALSGARRAAAGTAVETSKASRARIDALYEELVSLDRSGGDSARRAAILAELERLLAERAAGRAAKD